MLTADCLRLYRPQEEQETLWFENFGQGGIRRSTSTPDMGLECHDKHSDETHEDYTCSSSSSSWRRSMHSLHDFVKNHLHGERRTKPEHDGRRWFWLRKSTSLPTVMSRLQRCMSHDELCRATERKRQTGRDSRSRRGTSRGCRPAVTTRTGRKIRRVQSTSLEQNNYGDGDEIDVRRTRTDPKVLGVFTVPDTMLKHRDMVQRNMQLSFKEKVEAWGSNARGSVWGKTGKYYSMTEVLLEMESKQGEIM